MSDDLVKRLRDLGDHASFEPHMHHTAADRIEELEADLRYANKRIEHAFERNDRQAQTIDNLTTKLAKAVEALEKLDVGEGWAAQIARTTIAELTGGKDE